MRKYLLNSTLVATFIFLSSLGVSVPVMADDTDIYVDPSQPEPAEPLVMFNLDYTSATGASLCSGTLNATSGQDLVDNFGCPFSVEIADQIFAMGFHDDNGSVASKIDLYEGLLAAIRVVVATLDGVKIGIMMSNDHDDNCHGPQSSVKCSNGGVILRGLESVSDASSRQEFQDQIANIPGFDTGSASHSLQSSEAYIEFYRYLTGQDIYNGHNGYTNYGTTSAQNTDVDTPLATWDTSIENGTKYISPFESSNACADIYVLNLLFGTQDSGGYDSNTSPEHDGTQLTNTVALQGLGMPSISTAANAIFEEVLAYVHGNDMIPDTTTGSITVTADGIQNITSYIISKTVTNTQNDWAVAGGGRDTAISFADPDEMVTALVDVFEEILSISTTFVAPSVPVNVFNRAQVVDEVFLALFDADEDKKPFWPGNLKKLKVDFTQLTLVDAAGNNAIDPVDGRILSSSLSLWTDSTDSNLTLADPDGDADAGKDGRAVMRGGAGQQIPGYINDTTTAPGTANSTTTAVTRRLFTEAATITSPPGTDNNLFDLNADVAKATALWPEITRDWNPAATASTYTGATIAEQAKAINILEYARGLEDDGSTNRGWFMADPLHSQPLTINYGERSAYDDSDDNNDNSDIRIFVGTNDGFYHFITNTTSATTSDESGEEAWAFMPRELKPLADVIKNNAENGTPIHPITADGSAAALIIDANSDGKIDTAVSAVTGPPAVAAGTNDRVIIYVGLRRGGKSYYAIDATNPDSPELLWRISKYADPLIKTAADATACGTGNTFVAADGNACYDTDFMELGQTWSRPVVVKLDYGHASGSRNVLIFGGGYDGDDIGDDVADTKPTKLSGTTSIYGKDQANRDRKNGLIGVSNISIGEPDAEGNAIFIVDALTGDLVWKAVVDSDTTSNYVSGSKSRLVPNLEDSIVAELVAFDSTGDSLIDRAYVGDLGGQVWRIDLVGDDPSLWSVTRILNVGRHFDSTDKSTDRRFFNRVDVASTLDDTGDFDAILVGSGDREDPKAVETNNAFYLYKDRVVASTNSPTITERDPTGLSDLTDNCFQDSSCDATQVANITNGWFIDLADNGEKNLAPSLTLGGKVIFTTFSPNSVPLTCDLSEGLGRQYIVDLFDATAVQNFDTSNDVDGEVLSTTDRFDVLESGGIPVEAVPLGEGFILMQGQTSDGGGGEAGTVQNIEIGTYWKTFWYEAQE